MSSHEEQWTATTLEDAYDVVVVGGGPVGCVTGAALGRTGATVLVVEADPKMAHRLAGEWLHPPALEVLDRLRLGRLDGAEPQTGYGFTIFPDDGSPDIEMPYPEGTGMGAEHARIVLALRLSLARVPGVSLVLRARVTSIDLSGSEAVVRIERKDGRVHTVRARAIVGAEGKVSLVRTALGLPDASTLLSSMAGVELEVPRMPREGFGHVILGGPGPALFYRIDDTHVRGCLEVPLVDRATARGPYLWERYGSVVPEAMREPLRFAIEQRPILWTGIKFRPRAHFGREGVESSVPVALVGDACGHTHPMTAIGMTQGFLDAEALANSGFASAQRGWLSRYSEARGTAIPEILSNALYHCFRRKDLAATEVRRAMFKTLRESPRERGRTMQILGVQDSQRRSFSSAFMRIALRAMKTTVTTTASEGSLRALPSRLWAFSEWMQWPTAAVVPGRVSALYRAETTSERALPRLRGGRSESPRDLLAQRATTRSSTTREKVASDADRRTLELASAQLLSELEALARRLGTVPDAELAGPSLSLMRAITACPMRPGMAARMTLGRRRLATEGVARAVRADGDTRMVASLMLVLFDGAPWGEERVSDLDVAITHLLASETPGGGFANRRGERPDLETSALVLESLAALAPHTDAAREALAPVRARSRAWLEAELDQVTTLEQLSAAARVLAVAGRDAALIETLTTRLLELTPDGDGALAAAVLGLVVLRAEDPRVATLAAELASRLARPREIDGATLTSMVMAFATHAARPVRASAPANVTRATPGTEAKDASAHAGPVQTGTLGAVAAGVQTASHETASHETASHETASHETASHPIGNHPTAHQTGKVQTTRAASTGAGERSTPPDAADWAFCKEALEAVSRTFSQPIAFLPEELRVAVTLGYLLCRIADTIEDHPAVTPAEKPELFARFLELMEASVDLPQGAAIDTVALRALFGAVRAPDDAELSLARRTDVVVRVLMTLRKPVREILSRWVCEMARGMDLYTRRRPGPDGWYALHTVEDLDRYCYYVAGTVGHLLTDLFIESTGIDPRSEHALSLREDAESFAEGLQMVNILKDVTDDRERLVSFVPRTSMQREGLEPSTLVDREVRARAHAAVAPLFDRAEAHLDRALRYALAIPPGESGIRMFCLLPLFMAARTLVVARGNDAMFVPDAAVKISREEVASIIADCLRHSGDDDVLRARYAALRERPVVDRLRAQA